MKPLKVLGLTLASAGFLGLLAVGGPVARADGEHDAEVKEAETPAEVHIIDQTDEKEKTTLSLLRVPAKYYFETTLQSATYKLDAEADDTAESKTNENLKDDAGNDKGTIEKPEIAVLNGRSESDWKVTATIGDGKLTGGGAPLDISEFTLNGESLFTNGADGVVFSAEDVAAKITSTDEVEKVKEKTGELVLPVTAAHIEFDDVTHVLKAGDNLTGKIQYTLTDSFDPTDTSGEPTPDSNDLDDDGTPNAEDDDVDGDTQLNKDDTDVDGDKIPNEEDDDADADGIPKDEDDTPNGIGNEG